MKTILSIRIKQIQVQFQKHVVRITTDDELKSLLLHDAEIATNELVTAIKNEYAKQFGEAFTVSNDSLAIEIWGHVYADEFAGWMKKITHIHAIDAAANFVIERAEFIDIGEHGHDTNRFVWDSLCPLKSMIVLLLPR